MVGGVETLSGTNINYTGNTTVTGGTLLMYNARSFYNGVSGTDTSAETISIASGAVFSMYVDNTVNMPNYAATPMNEVLGTNGTVNVTGSGTFLLTGNGALGGNPANNNTHAVFAMSPGSLIDIEGAPLSGTAAISPLPGRTIIPR